MGRRQDLSSLLSSLPGEHKVYGQAPSKDRMQYPCITFELDDEKAEYADNIPYHRILGWQVTVIDRDVNSEIPGHVASLPMSAFRRSFVVDNLNHTVYKLFF